MTAPVITPELRARILALRGQKSSTAIAEQLGLKAGTVRKVCHVALVRGEVPALATRRGDPKAARIPNSLPGRLRKAPGRPGYIVEGGARFVEAVKEMRAIGAERLEAAE